MKKFIFTMMMTLISQAALAGALAGEWQGTGTWSNTSGASGTVQSYVNIVGADMIESIKLLAVDPHTGAEIVVQDFESSYSFQPVNGNPYQLKIFWNNNGQSIQIGTLTTTGNQGSDFVSVQGITAYESYYLPDAQTWIRLKQLIDPAGGSTFINIVDKKQGSL